MANPRSTGRSMPATSSSLPLLAIALSSLCLVANVGRSCAWTTTLPTITPKIIRTCSTTSREIVVPSFSSRQSLLPHYQSRSTTTTQLYSSAQQQQQQEDDNNNNNDNLLSSSLLETIQNIDPSSLPILHIGKRIGSGSYGTVHQCTLIRSKTDVQSCIAKRSWTLPELQNNVPSAVLEMEQFHKQQLMQQQQQQQQQRQMTNSNNDGNSSNDENGSNNASSVIAPRTGLASIKGGGIRSFQQPSYDADSNRSNNNNKSGNNNNNNNGQSSSLEVLQTRASRCKHYWNVEKHCFQKLMNVHAQGGEMSTMDAIPVYFGVFWDDGSGVSGGAIGRGDGDGVGMVEGYGLLEEEKKGFFESFGSSDGDDGSIGKGHEWMVFETVGGTTTPSATKEGGGMALTLLDAMELDLKNQRLQNNEYHHLHDVQKAMNLPESYEFGDVLDCIFRSLLEDMVFIHSCNIVHRDLKPGNLLCDSINQRLRLIDFGSAADLDPSPIPSGGANSNPFGNVFSGGNQRIGLDEGIVAVSPVYAAPETFVQPNENPMSFDCFSTALIMCQLLFNLLDERTDAGFHQQIENMGYDLDLWLERELGAKLRPAGFDDALEYLGERRGLWGLLKKMFAKNPMMRIKSKAALAQFEETMGLRNGEIDWTDDIIVKVAREEAYFETVIDSFERCEVSFVGMDEYGLVEEGDCGQEIPRPLHFVASFDSSMPAGLVLAEALGDDDESNEELMSEDLERWERATKGAIPGEVFIKGFAPGGQAERMGIFEVGDRLRGVGELPFVDSGFEQAINMITKQPQSGKTLKLHFDRLSKPRKPNLSDLREDGLRRVKVAGQGAWKSKGRRNAQEDSFVLHEVYNRGVGDVLLAGVFDGHGGTAASESVSRILPSLFAEELALSSRMGSAAIRNALEQSWETTCSTYRNGCDDNGECIADYDPTEGILFAETGSIDLIAGTTGTMAAISMSPSGTKELTVANCGDSRTLLVGHHHSPGLSDLVRDDSVVVFETRDHSPDDEKEIQRLKRGREQGYDYSIPQCSMSQSWMQIGDYQYALCRSLEGSYVTSKGIVSDPDVTTLNLANMLADRQHCALVLACDGLFEVMSNEEVGKEVIRMREAGYAPGELAKNLCGQAMKKGSYDNISVVVIYLDEV